MSSDYKDEMMGQLTSQPIAILHFGAMIASDSGKDKRLVFFSCYLPSQGEEKGRLPVQF